MGNNRKSNRKTGSTGRKTAAQKRNQKRRDAKRKAATTKTKSGQEYQRYPYTEAESRYIAQLYEQGYEIERIASMTSKKFGTPRTHHTVQGHLSRLRRNGTVKPRGRGKKPTQDVVRQSATGEVEYSQTRRLSADLGNRGKVEIQVSGPVVLDTEFMEDLSQSLGKLVSSG